MEALGNAARMIKDAEESLANIRRDIEALKIRERAAVERVHRARRWQAEEAANYIRTHEQAGQGEEQ